MDFCQIEEDLIRDEGLRLRAYICPAGKLTIGVGHRVTRADRLDKNSRISLERAGFLLSTDISAALGAANRIFGRVEFVSWPDARQRAIVNMIFNLGETGFRGFERMIPAIKAGDWHLASLECLDSLYARQVGRRAQRIAEALRTGSD